MRAWRGREHPHLLPWLGARRLDGAEARKVEDHLARCEECSDVAASIASMSRSLRGAASEHIGAEELVEWEEGRLREDAARCARIEVHLAACAECRQDLEALRGAHVASASRPRAARRWALAAAAVIAIGATLSVVMDTWRASKPLSVVLLPASRSETVIPTLDGSRSWAIQIVLPYSARSKRYRARLEREDGTPLRSIDGLLEREDDGRIHLSLDPVSRAGLYRLVLEPEEGGPDVTCAYGIRVQ